MENHKIPLDNILLWILKGGSNMQFIDLGRQYQSFKDKMNDRIQKYWTVVFCFWQGSY